MELQIGATYTKDTWEPSASCARSCKVLQGAEIHTINERTSTE